MDCRVGLICGYRRTGKDKLYSILKGTDVSERFQWRVYKNPANILVINKNLSSNKYARISFADKLKLEASEEYNIPKRIPDQDKDLKQFIHPQTKELVSARDIYIEWGSIRRTQDIDYWCKEACKGIDTKKMYLVTDWRFQNEAEFLCNNYQNSTTIRIYRSEVPEPDLNIESEHNLDNYCSDLLLLQDDNPEEFAKALKRFPQYILYVPCELI